MLTFYSWSRARVAAFTLLPAEPQHGGVRERASIGGAGRAGCPPPERKRAAAARRVARVGGALRRNDRVSCAKHVHNEEGPRDPAASPRLNCGALCREKRAQGGTPASDTSLLFARALSLPLFLSLECESSAEAGRERACARAARGDGFLFCRRFTSCRPPRRTTRNFNAFKTRLMFLSEY